MKIDFYWQEYRYFDYERSLAKRELTTLLGVMPATRPFGFTVEVEGDTIDWRSAAHRTTYFKKAVTETGEQIIPLQMLLEASANGNLQFKLDGLDVAPVLNRQSTRYSAHGFHEYRGKFNPQMVRAIGNLLNLSPGSWVLDPFCGSGTTLLEALHNRWNAIGMDLNPLGVEIASAKLAAMRIPLDVLLTLHQTLTECLSARIAGISLNDSLSQKQLHDIGGVNWRATLPNFEYLQSWFTEPVLVQLSSILQAIAEIPIPEARCIGHMALSAILREVSLQAPEDLRIRRRKSPPLNMPVIPLFLDTLSVWIETVAKARRYVPVTTTIQRALLGDTRQIASTLTAIYPRHLFDAAITSPPYVTAMPYIDTHRLSLTVLGLISANEIRETERRLIGNREITNQQRLALEAAMQVNRQKLPKDCWQFCKQLAQALDPEQDGFRRQNMPGLVYQYFSDMAQMFEQVKQVLRPGARYVLVVGPNRTRLGGHEFTIDTAKWLCLIAEERGFQQIEALELDTYQRYDVHQANSIRSETLLILEATSNAC